MTAGLRKGAVAFSMAALLAAQPALAVATPLVTEGAQQEQPASDSQEPAAAEPEETSVETPKADASNAAAPKTETAPKAEASTAEADEAIGNPTAQDAITVKLGSESKNFATYEEAVKAINEYTGEDTPELTLNQDVEETALYSKIAKSCVINLGDYTLHAADATADAWSAGILASDEGVTVTVNASEKGGVQPGGIAEGPDGASVQPAMAMWSQLGANIVINGGRYATDNDSTLLYSIKDGLFTINDGYFSVAKPVNYGIDWYYVLNANNGNTVQAFTVNGGTFVNYDPFQGDDNQGTSKGSFVAPGKGVTKNENGTFSVAKAAAQVLVPNTNANDKVHPYTSVAAYDTLQKAVENAPKGAAVKLVADTTENVTVPASADLTLDLAGHTLNGGNDQKDKKAALINNGTVTIKDSSGDDSGRIVREDNGKQGYYVIDNQGTMTIESGSVYNATGSMPDGSSLIRNAGNETEAKLTITGGHIKQDGFIAVKNDDRGILNITGGTIEATGNVPDHTPSAVQNWCKANITGGTINGAVWTGTWTDKFPASVTTIDGDAKVTGKIISRQEGTGFSAAPTINIKGGTINVKDAGWQVISPAKVAVSGGKFDDAVPEDYCAEGYVPVDNGNGTFGVQADSEAAAFAKVENGGKTEYFDSLSDAVRNAATGSTVTLLKSTSESVNVSKKLNFTAASDKVVYSGQIQFDKNANGSTVKGMHFEQTASPRVDANVRIQSASNVEVSGNTFKISNGATGQPNSIIIAAWGIVDTDKWAVAAKDNKVLNNTFDIECSQESSSVAVNLQGSAVNGVTLSGNKVTVTDPGDTHHNAFFLIGINSDKEKGTMDNITVSGNKFSANDAAKSAANFVGLSGVQSVTGTKNEVSSANQGFGVTSWQGVSHQNEKVSLSGNTYTNVTNPVNVKSPEADKATSTFTGASVETKSGNSATTKDYATFNEAIDAAKDGDTVTLLGESSENVDVNKNITVTAASKDFAYTGTMTVTADGTKVQNMSFELDPAKKAQNLKVSKANDVEISGNTFTIKSGDTSVGQPNSVWLEGGASNTKISKNTFDIGQVKGTSAVGVNLVGGTPAIDGTVIDGNTVASKGSGDSGSMMFVVGNGNTEEGYGIGTLTVTNNKVDGSVNANKSYGISIAGVNNLVANGNTLKGLAFGISFSAWGATLQKPGTDDAHYDPMPKKNGSISVSGNKFIDNTAANVYFAARNKDGKSVTLVDKAAYGTGQDANTFSTSTYNKTAPIAPTGSGMAFAGWYTDESFATPATEGTKTAYAKWAPISDVVTFMGNSFRVDNAANYSKVDMRFGYALKSADGIKSIESWSWEAGYDGKKEWDVTGVHSRKPTKQEIAKGVDKNATVSNLVVEGIPLPKYGKATFYAKVKVSYTTADGTKASLTDSSRTRTVENLAQTISEKSQDPTEREVANGILGKLNATDNE